MNNAKVQQLIDVALDENPSLFLVDLSIGSDNKISIVIDGDEGVPLNECIRISRAVEHNLDREELDFSLDVSTPDIAKPLVLNRQYKKNIGRLLKVKASEGTYEGTLQELDEESIVLGWKERVPKTIGKGKMTIEQTKKVLFSDIIEAKVKIVFN